MFLLAGAEEVTRRALYARLKAQRVILGHRPASFKFSCSWHLDEFRVRFANVRNTFSRVCKIGNFPFDYDPCTLFSQNMH